MRDTASCPLNVNPGPLIDVDFLHFIYVFFLLLFDLCVLHIHCIYEHRISNLHVSNLALELHTPSSQSADFEPQRRESLAVVVGVFGVVEAFKLAVCAGVAGVLPADDAEALAFELSRSGEGFCRRARFVSLWCALFEDFAYFFCCFGGCSFDCSAPEVLDASVFGISGVGISLRLSCSGT